MRCYSGPRGYNHWWTGMLVQWSVQPLIGAGFDPSSGLSVWICMFSTCLTGHSKLPLSVSVCEWQVCVTSELSSIYSRLFPSDCWDKFQPHLTLIRNKEANQSVLKWSIQRFGFCWRSRSHLHTHASWKNWCFDRGLFHALIANVRLNQRAGQLDQWLWEWQNGQLLNLLKLFLENKIKTAE